VTALGGNHAAATLIAVADTGVAISELASRGEKAAVYGGWAISDKGIAMGGLAAFGRMALSLGYAEAGQYKMSGSVLIDKSLEKSEKIIKSIPCRL
jgi:hypothetical protein